MKKINLICVAVSSILSAVSAHAANVDQRTNDTTVLQAWRGAEVAPSTFEGGFTMIDITKCAPAAGMYSSRDCTQVVQNALRNSSDSAPPGLATGFSLPGNSDGGICQTWEIRTVTKLSAINDPLFNGIGFSFETGMSEGTSASMGQNVGWFVPKAQLDRVGTQVTLKDGSPAIIHRFIAQGSCMAAGDDGYGMEYSLIQFRPYVRFNTNTDQYTNWDSVQSDYRLGNLPTSGGFGSNAQESFDRQSQLLQ